MRRIGGVARRPSAPSRAPAISAASEAVRINVLVAMSAHVPSIDHRGVVVVLTPKRTMLTPLRRRASCRRSLSILARCIGDAAQRQRQRAELLRQRQRFGLTRRELERRGLADHDLLAVLFLDVLVDRQHAHIAEDRFRWCALRRRPAFSASRSRRVRMTSTRSFGRMKPPAPVSGEICVETARMPVGRIAAMKPEPLRVDQLGFADRLAGDERHARDHAGEIFDGLRAVVLANEISGRGAGRPCLPLHIAGRQRPGPSQCRLWRPGRRRFRPVAASGLTSGGFSERPANSAATHRLRWRRSARRYARLSYAHSHT